MAKQARLPVGSRSGPRARTVRSECVPLRRSWASDRSPPPGNHIRPQDSETHRRGRTRDRARTCRSVCAPVRHARALPQCPGCAAGRTATDRDGWVSRDPPQRHAMHPQSVALPADPRNSAEPPPRGRSYLPHHLNCISYPAIKNAAVLHRPFCRPPVTNFKGKPCSSRPIASPPSLLEASKRPRLTRHNTRWRSPYRLKAASVAKPPAVGNGHHDEDFVRAWCIGDRHRYRVEMRERPRVVLVTERHIEAGARCSDLDVRGYHSLATAYRVPHRLAQHRVDTSAAVL